MAISKTPAPPSRSSLLRRIRALESRLEELGGPAADPAGPEARAGHEDRAPEPDPAAEIQELVACGRPLTAARRYRELTGCDDAEARRAVEILSGGTGDDC
ncbi:hypothetical protein [Patulibacter americanus]|uniref:hypothetical protein n=1 Tax=Patulibacter americanus TaxID=588672 RepID=UPI0003B6194F|nr:hypothetical protein [Patulibacter americanus]